MKNLNSPFKNNNDKPILITGPCSAETLDQVLSTAKELKENNTCTYFRSGIWKPRTRPNSFEGVGESGIPWLLEVKKQFGFPVATEVANKHHLEACLKNGIDLVWIGARTTASPFAMQELADVLQGVDIPVLVKNPVNAELNLWIGGMERLHKAGVKQIGAIHRGFSGIENSIYRNLPMWNLSMELKRIHPEIPVICDPSHICGRREPLAKISQYAMDIGLDGLMIETHIDPSSALSDAGQQITPSTLKELVNGLIVKSEKGNHKAFEHGLEFLRAKIDRLDDELITLLQQRGEVAKEIGELKSKEKVTIFQQARLDELLELRKTQAAKCGVSEEFVDKMFHLIHEESVRIQLEQKKKS